MYIILSVFLTAMCYKSLIDPTCGTISKKEIFGYSLTTASLSRSFLGRYAEITLLYFLKKRGVEYGRGLTIFLVDKIITLVVQTIVSIIGLAYFFFYTHFLDSTEFILIFMVILGVMFIAIYLLKQEGVRVFIKEKILRKHQDKFKQFSSTFHQLYCDHKSALFLNVLYTTLRLILTGVVVASIFWYLGAPLSIWYVIIINTILMTASLIPLTANGIGIRETLGVYLFGTLGVAPIVSVSVYLIFRIGNYLFGLLLLPHTIRLYFQSKKEKNTPPKP